MGEKGLLIQTLSINPILGIVGMPMVGVNCRGQHGGTAALPATHGVWCRVMWREWSTDGNMSEWQLRMYMYNMHICNS